MCVCVFGVGGGGGGGGLGESPGTFPTCDWSAWDLRACLWADVGS